jgi:hypothetical protein
MQRNSPKTGRGGTTAPPNDQEDTLMSKLPETTEYPTPAVSSPNGAEPAEEAVDPFDTERLRSASLENIAVEKITLTIPVRRPGRNEFFRVHPDPAMTVDWYVLEHDDDMDHEVYWVTEQFRAALLDELKPVRIFVCINKRGTQFLWPARIPSTDNRLGRRWHESALEIADQAKTLWVKMQGKRDLGAYEMYRAQGDLGEPQWVDKSLSDLLRLAFKGDRLISSIDHPVLRDLVGEI